MFPSLSFSRALTLPLAIFILLAAFPARPGIVDPEELFLYALYWTQTGVMVGSETHDFTPPDLLCTLAGGCQTDPQPSRVWFVDNSLLENGDGSLANPFNSLDPVNSLDGEGDADGPGEAIFLFQGSDIYNAGLNLENNQFLFGQGTDLVVGGQTLVEGMPSQAPILDSTGLNRNTVNLRDNCLIRGVNLRVDRRAGIFGSGISGTVIRDVSITRSGGDPSGIEIRDCSPGFFLIQRAKIANTGRGISLRNCLGTFSILDTTSSETTDPSLSVNGGDCDIFLSGNTVLSRAGANPISISNGHSGQLTAGPGSLIEGNSLIFNGADGTYVFNGPVRLRGFRSRLNFSTGTDGTFAFHDVTIHSELPPPPSTPTAAINFFGAGATVEILKGAILQEGESPLVGAGGGDQSSLILPGGGSVTLQATNGTLVQLEQASGEYLIGCPMKSLNADHGVDIHDGFEGRVEIADLTIVDPTGTAIRAEGGAGEVRILDGTVISNLPIPVMDIGGKHEGLIELALGVRIEAASSDGFRFQSADGVYRFLGELRLEGGNSGVSILDSDGDFTFGDLFIHNTLSGRGVDIDGTVTKALSESFNGSDFPRGWSKGNLIVDGTSVPNLWHVSAVRSEDNLPGHSAPYCLYYGQNETSQAGGDFNTGNRNGGFVYTPPFTVPATDGIFRMRYHLETEDSSQGPRFPDICTVNQFAGGGLSPILNTLDGTLVNTPGGWMEATYDLSPFAGSSYVFVFGFDSRDELDNDGEGWMVDDVEVLGAGSAIANATFEKLEVITQGGTGIRVNMAGTVRVGTLTPAVVNSTDAPALELRDHAGQLNFATVSSSNAFAPGIDTKDIGGSLSIAGGIITAGSPGVSAVRATQIQSELCLDLEQMTLAPGTGAEGIQLMQSVPGTLAVSQSDFAELMAANGNTTVGATGTIGFGCDAKSIH